MEIRSAAKEHHKQTDIITASHNIISLRKMQEKINPLITTNTQGWRQAGPHFFTHSVENVDADDEADDEGDGARHVRPALVHHGDDAEEQQEGDHELRHQGLL